MMILMPLNHLVPKEVHSFKCSDIPTRYVPVPLEQSPTTLLLESTGYDFSQTWTFRVHATTIQSNRGDIFFTNARGSMGIGILEETH